MCGPLVLALPGRQGRVTAQLLYHLGRVTTYSLLGGVVGATGAGLSRATGAAGGLDWVARLQVSCSLVAAAVLLLFGLARLGITAEPAWLGAANPARIPGFRRVRQSAADSGGGIFLLGLMLGLLPCGLSYAAFARALPAGGPLEGALLVAGFGLGTVPGLLLLGTAAAPLARRYARWLDVLSGLLLVALAVSLAADALTAALS